MVNGIDEENKAVQINSVCRFVHLKSVDLAVALSIQLVIQALWTIRVGLM